MCSPQTQTQSLSHLGGPAFKVEGPEVKGEFGDLLVVAEAPVDLVPRAQALHLLHLGGPGGASALGNFCH